MLTHNWNNHAITQLTETTKIGKFDVPASYVNATQMCQACGKQFNDYARLDSTNAYWEGLSLETGIPVSNLVITVRGRGDKIPQGTWAHPEIAIDCAQWVSVEFRIWANRALRKMISGETPAPSQPLTQIQILASITQQMAFQEQQLLQQDARIAVIEAEQERNKSPHGHYYTVMGFANLHKISITPKDANRKGRAASHMCRLLGVKVEKVKDARYGYVGMYPEEILVQVFK